MSHTPYTAIRSIVGLTGEDILTGEELFPVIGGNLCAMYGMGDQIVYTLGIVIPYKTKNVGEKRQFDESVIEEKK